MSIRPVVYAGWMLVAIGVVMVAGGAAAAADGGSAAAGLLFGLGVAGLLCAVAGASMVWFGRGWDTPLDNEADFHKYGRPANAEVLSVEETAAAGPGARAAKLSLRIAPVNESAFKTTRTVAIPDGRLPSVGETVTVKFDPNKRKSFVLLEHNFEVKDQITQAVDAFFGGLQR